MNRTASDEDVIRERLHGRGLRWTSQRATLLTVLRAAEGHITGAELIERCRRIDPATTPSTVYRTLDVLEEIGIVSHSHGLDGREEFHVRPERDHGHVLCEGCGSTSELSEAEAAPLTRSLEASRGFAVELGHLTVVGRCRECATRA
jgi:Fur family ferric uptake transcriptional regulator